MSDYAGSMRSKGQNLLVVEGNHEKNKLFELIFRCFPEININLENVWIYGTNIYMLYEDIVKEYGTGWTAEDIDLPFIISRKQNPAAMQYKEDFVNIILVFDYERHDPNFSQRKIQEMQEYFTDAADTGQLYLNYPMIESYQHLKGLPDEAYAERKIPVSLQPGSQYKGLVREETVIAGLVEFPHKIQELLREHFGITDAAICKKCFENILDVSDESSVRDQICNTLQTVLEGKNLKTAIYQFSALVTDLGYVHTGKTYWEYMREVFRQIIFHNICKAQRIQYGSYQIDSSEYRECFYNLNLGEILKIQNTVSQNDQTGYIWVLSTCVFFIAEYNFSLVDS